MKILTQERLREVLDYDADTGVFTWRVRRGRMNAGKTAGSVHPVHRNIHIGVDGKLWPATMLAWLYVHGVMPEGEIDHRNGVRVDNRFENLRDCTHAQNAKNMSRHRDGASGLKGVYWHKRAGRWMSQIMADGRQQYLGLFDTKEDAARAYNVAAMQLHGEYARMNIGV